MERTEAVGIHSWRRGAGKHKGGGVAAGRYCVKCGKNSVHRSALNGAERMLSYLVLQRRDRCYRCGARPWVSLRGSRARSAIVVAGLFWLGLAAGLAYLLQQLPSDAVAPVVVAAAAPAVEEVVAAVPVESSPELPPQGVDEFAPVEPTAVIPEEVPAAVTAAVPATDSAPATVSVQRLRSVDARWHQNRMEISLQLDEGRFPPHTLIFDKAAGGYVMDLPGHWQLPPQLRMSRSFTRSSLRQMNIGRHDEFLRVVFRLRGPATAAPVVSEDEGKLLLRFR